MPFGLIEENNLNYQTNSKFDTNTMMAMDIRPPRLEQLAEKKLVGIRCSMSILENKTYQLFNTFMPRRNEISLELGKAIFDLRVYPDGYFDNFSPANLFTKWALKEVADFRDIPAQMETFTLKKGLYTVFNYKGGADKSVFEYIYTKWLPSSDYVLDPRPHFEIMAERYKPGDPNAEEEIYIPVSSKTQP